jgi:flagellar basal-body rod modification protein FlgD
MSNISPTGTSSSSNAVQSQNSSNSSTGNGVDKLANEQTFLQLFVSQLKNQDPLNPADGTQFVSQLAQFSELEQVIGINQNVGAIRQQVAPASNSGATATSQSTSGS